MRRALIGLAAAGAVALTAGCGVGPDKSREDAHDTTDVDKTAAHVVAFNNRYSNVSTKCDGYGHRIFVTTSKVFVVMPDPTCPGFVDGKEPMVIGSSQAPAQK